MSKDFEELEILINKTGCMNDTCAHLGDCLKDNKCRYNDDNLMCPDYKMAKTLKDDLTELKAIKESNPSEALECLEEIRDFRYGKDKLLVCQTEMYKQIKQALIKAQEQEKMLEIINKKSVYIHLLQQCGDVESYNNYFITKYGLDEFTERLLLTQEEFELLKRYCDRKESE